jgi:hypothetical protein
MHTKLTLTIEQSIIDVAKRYAAHKRQSLSSIIENYMKSLTKEAAPDVITLTPTVKMLKGSFSVPKNFNYKKELTDRLSNKYMQK